MRTLTAAGAQGNAATEAERKLGFVSTQIPGMPLPLNKDKRTLI